ncbi:hypothetical protein COT07_02320 [Candidatus Woesearchaeota archaeon CG07_land_8_20_14_0_80_44_23]|nr:MAG: hypothetical protein COT07_02320 [Candidatus Woesearchaeota archaeon CG07_land_8_20_14_0_80_44_23]
MEYDSKRLELYNIVKDSIISVAESQVIGEIRPDSEFRNLGIDSLMSVDLMFEIEDKIREAYKIKDFTIPGKVLEKMNTVDNAVQALYNSIYVWENANELFENYSAFSNWLSIPIDSLDKRTPIEVIMEGESGRKRVLEILARLEWGIPE